MNKARELTMDEIEANMAKNGGFNIHPEAGMNEDDRDFDPSSFNPSDDELESVDV